MSRIKMLNEKRFQPSPSWQEKGETVMKLKMVVFSSAGITRG
jgi:hypothetical protein